MKRTVLSILLISSFLMPSFAFANEEEAIATLSKQIQLLIQEVERLQQLISGGGIAQDHHAALTDEELRTIIHSGIQWFKEAQEENGHLKYEYEPYTDSYLPKDNIVRQAGGLYALGETAVHDIDDTLNLKDVLLSRVRYFDALSGESSWNGYEFRCVGNSHINETCQLGTTGLVLIGVIDMVERYPDLKETYDDLIHDYGTYIIAMKKKGSGFRHVYTDGTPPGDDESSFSNGEALLALTRYYMYSPREETKQVIDDTFAYIESEAVPFDFPLYLWVMAALKDMQELFPDERYVEYVKEYTEWRMNGFAYRKGSSHNMCAYVEGLVSAKSVLQGEVHDAYMNRLDLEINYWLQHSKQFQIDERDRFRIIYDEEGGRFAEITNMNRAKGGFLTGFSELTQRIDFTQHCVNSYLQELVDIRGKSLY